MDTSVDNEHVEDGCLQIADDVQSYISDNTVTEEDANKKLQFSALYNNPESVLKHMYTDLPAQELPERQAEHVPASRVTVYNDNVSSHQSLTVDTNTLKNTINQVFWEKINSHVEELLNNLENDKPVITEGSHFSAERHTRGKKVNRLLTVSERDLEKLPHVPRSGYNMRSANQRKSMLEISSPDIEDNLISVFRRSMHCTDSCIIRVVDRSGISRQSHFNRTLPMVCIDRSLLKNNASRIENYNCLRITRMRNNESIDAFKNTDVFAKRSVIRGGDILRTLAVYEMREKFDFQEQSYLDKESRKVMYNKFTNMQRLDRGVGSRLKWQFMDRHNIEETDTIEMLEEKAAVSFSIFGHDGYLIYESKKYRMKHVTMIKDVAGLYYFIPQKMLGAFGSQWNRRKRSCRQDPIKTTKICRNVQSSPPTSSVPLISDEHQERNIPDDKLGFNPLRMPYRRDPVRTTKICGKVVNFPLPPNAPIISGGRLERNDVHDEKLGFNPLRMRHKQEPVREQFSDTSSLTMLVEKRVTMVTSNTPHSTTPQRNPSNSKMCIAVTNPTTSIHSSEPASWKVSEHDKQGCEDSKADTSDNKTASLEDGSQTNKTSSSGASKKVGYVTIPILSCGMPSTQSKDQSPKTLPLQASLQVQHNSELKNSQNAITPWSCQKKCPIETFRFEEIENLNSKTSVVEGSNPRDVAMVTESRSMTMLMGSKKRSPEKGKPAVIKKVANFQSRVQSGKVFAKGDVLLTTKDHIILRSLEEGKPALIKKVANFQSGKMFPKGEVLLTTKDHIILRIPRGLSDINNSKPHGS